MTRSRFAIGDRVRPSAYALEDKRMRAVEYKRTATPTKAQRWYDEAKARRGTVSALVPRTDRLSVACGIAPSLTIAWDDGTVSHCDQSMVEREREMPGDSGEEMS